MALTTGDPTVDVRLERIQAAVDVGNAQIKGQLDVLMLRHDQSEKLSDEREKRVGNEFKERDERLTRLEGRVGSLSKQIWLMVGGTGVLGATASVGVQVLLRK